jgi:pantetheine-phosphate adenylyltransferase
MSTVAVVPGSFDPVTLGHLDVIERAAGLFDEVHVVVVHNPGKEAMFPIAQRVTLLEQAIAQAGITGKLVVTSWSVGLLVDYCTDVGATVLVKGIRSNTDVAYEQPMAIVNRNLAESKQCSFFPIPRTLTCRAHWFARWQRSGEMSPRMFPPPWLTIWRSRSCLSLFSLLVE